DYGEIERIYLTPGGTLDQADDSSNSDSSSSNEGNNDSSN
ncbi:type II secretion system protein GspJ, partial [Vibrio sp. 10N.222.54.A1]